ncbi:SKI family transcriptional corepressor 2 [Liparis tanakae]|uniref:Immediate early response 3-interacting protein 1 n=1 Tax=Liparis tanakae TaxID=230148 RepID=A0A4Z2J8M5_9TELE|nr:SKI family transcriptional corepressor 2 [Liparis tanakae]
MEKEELQKVLLEQIDFRRRLEQEFHALKGTSPFPVFHNFQDQMKRELAYREEMVQQLQMTAILCINAIAVLHEERFLSKFGFGVDQGVGGFGDDPGVKAQILTLIRSIRTVMRGGYPIYTHIVGH